MTLFCLCMIRNNLKNIIMNWKEEKREREYHSPTGLFPRWSQQPALSPAEVRKHGRLPRYPTRAAGPKYFVRDSVASQAACWDQTQSTWDTIIAK